MDNNNPTANVEKRNALRAYLRKQNLVFSWRRYGVEALNFMALGLFSSLILGLILKNIGVWAKLPWLVEVGQSAQAAMGACVGVGVAFALQAPPLALFASAAVGLIGASLGGPVGAFLAALIGAECGKAMHRLTPVDIVATPAATLLSGAAGAYLFAPLVASLMAGAGAFVMWAVALSPFLMSAAVAVAMGLFLTLPISSAAIAIALGLSDLAGGAATVGCAAQMIGFAVLSYRDNGAGGALACALGTSMIQMPNILKNPKIWIPPTLAGAILAPVATAVFGMTNLPEGAGMGTSGLVGQIASIESMGARTRTLLLVGAFHFVLPALLTWLIARVFYAKGWIKDGDLRLGD